MSKKILITGSTGSIGRIMPKNKSIIPILTRLESRQEDLLKEIKYYKAKTLIHLGGMVDKYYCEKNKRKCFEINVLGSQKLFNAAVKAQIEKFIFVSTSDIYKPISKMKLIDINHKKKPDSYYSQSKLYAEKRLIKIANKNKNIRLSIARVFNTKSLITRKNSLEERINYLAKNGKIEFIDGLNKVRDILSTTEVCNQLIKLAYSERFPRFANICSEQPTLLYDYVSLIYKKYNVNFKKIYSYKVSTKKNFLVGKKTIF